MKQRIECKQVIMAMLLACSIAGTAVTSVAQEAGAAAPASQLVPAAAIAPPLVVPQIDERDGYFLR